MLTTCAACGEVYKQEGKWVSQSAKHHRIIQKVIFVSLPLNVAWNYKQYMSCTGHVMDGRSAAQSGNKSKDVH